MTAIMKMLLKMQFAFEWSWCLRIKKSPSSKTGNHLIILHSFRNVVVFVSMTVQLKKKKLTFLCPFVQELFPLTCDVRQEALIHAVSPLLSRGLTAWMSCSVQPECVRVSLSSALWKNLPAAVEFCWT